ncbi:MAG: hypothetical protein ACTFAL_00095 [Candidatus Electronema sp. V4]|uniref:hypothetical protein n=1 Tax=Candidatus Electronema sp. V4 TaxID=3454756 RepID=UPI0040554FB0
MVVDKAQLYLNAHNSTTLASGSGTQHRENGSRLPAAGSSHLNNDETELSISSYVSRAYNLYEQFRFPAPVSAFPFPFFFQFTVRAREPGKIPRAPFYGLAKPHIYELYDSLSY